MGSLISNYIVIVSVSGVLNALLALFAFYKKTDFAGIRAFVCSSFFSAIYIFGFALELSGNSMQEIGFWIKVEYLGMPFIAPCSLLMIMHFVGLERLINKKLLVPLFAVPIISTLLVWTNEYHHLFYKSMVFREGAPSLVVDVVMGPWYIVQGSMTFGSMLAGMCLILWQWNRMKRVYRRQMITIFVGQFLPAMGAFLYLIDKTPYGMDPVPVIMSVTSTLYFWAILSRGMLTAAPIARENLFESMRDGVLVTDRFDMLIDYNRAATGMMEGLDSSAVGRSLAQLFLPAGKDAVDYVMSADPLLSGERELAWNIGGSTCYYEVRSSPVLKKDGSVAGRMIMLIDVTERTLLQDKLRQLATIDNLTGIYNRTHFMELSRELLIQAQDSKSPFSIILLDIDFFKNINDRYGHQYGDMALQHVVGVCSRHIRERDVFGRYGGEEFVICLPDTPLKQAALLSEQIRSDVERSPMYTVSGQINVTASFGVVESLPHDVSLEELLSEADHALYTSKRNGRNAVHISSGAAITHFRP
ncbi:MULTISPECIES: histidine kinase N-terminal 7TM domain-containing protein [unclassified Paenibacillus]|uniref:histidine kinase N-terminal 7TM domain-containing diguanylate cyclase n=1 Tax=unclassified Paenibacillus TaxID=185978 RepID=UPI002407629C|nr:MULTISPECIES: histidine kinase N-terminal 7TM domain-containing protein [unclassified Paenibacillus]MDF9839987.1 diguanylate cyclase (GGDEF)-like protein/PAS domain S-box-containing protein [Paenibacillus sp. PastF-2]MDF9846569.1 diguanylate cyclase (GGDEF)-like protein/PAS domain S-box-containing protein [Paenibacillus sp. PastM-2]MDF9853083.1 diguanylate cyclase (GGDEF)-like protein/PAS domain S-box-containing protein [Paenibacillus sp. PastF-1]MDH6478413.1 diguanylate cyclase (GGDEF)-like